MPGISAQVEDDLYQKLSEDLKKTNAKNMSEVVRNRLTLSYEREFSEREEIEIADLKLELQNLKATLSKLLGASIHHLITQYEFIRVNIGEEKFREIKNVADQKLEQFKTTGKLTL